MKISKNIKNGFTLIELMITVAIVGILSSVALPAYQDYTIRSQVSEGLYLTNGAKVFIINHYSDRGLFPVDNLEASFPGGVGRYVTSVEIEPNGVITATFGGKSNDNLKNETLSLVAEETTAGNLEWSCISSMNASDKNKFLPQICR